LKLRRGALKGTSTRSVGSLPKGAKGHPVGTCSRCKGQNVRLDIERLCEDCVRVATPRDPSRIDIWIWACNRWWKT
jgi:hypothetical protein